MMPLPNESELLDELEETITGPQIVRVVEQRPRESLGALATEAVVGEMQQAIAALHQSSTVLTAAIGRMLEQSNKEIAELRVRLSELQQLQEMATASIDATAGMIGKFTGNLSERIAQGCELGRRVVSSSEALQRELREDQS